MLYKIVQFYDESVLEISLHEDRNASFVPDLEPYEGGPLDVLLQGAKQPEEIIKTDMYPNLLHQPEAMQPSLIQNQVLMTLRFQQKT